MKFHPFLITACLVAGLAAGPPSTAQTTDSELQELEQMAQDSFARDELDTAVALYRQLASRQDEDSEKVRVMMNVAWLEHLRGRPEQARSTLTEVLVLEPAYVFRPELYNEPFARLFYDAQKRALEKRKARASQLVRQGAGQLRGRDYDAARNSFEQALEAWAEQPKAIYNLALVDYYQERYDDALAGFQKLLALAASRPELVDDSLRGLAATNVGLLFSAQGQEDEAARLLEEAVRLSPENATAWSNLALTRRRLGDVAGAAEAARRALELDPDDVGSHRSLGLALLDDGRPGEAAELLAGSTSKFSEDAGLWLYLGLAQRRLDRPRDAEAALRRAIDRDPGNAGGWAASAALQLASLAYEQGDDRQAGQHAETVVAWRPDDAGGFIYLGLAQKGLGELEDARQSLEKARSLDPTQAETHNSLGSTYFELGRLDKAEEAFRRALTIDPGHAEAQRNLDAVAAVRRGDAVAAPRAGSRRTVRAPARPDAPPAKSAAPPSSRVDPPPQAPPPPAPSGRRVDLGWRFSSVDYKSLGLQGVMVEKVLPETPAARAGVLANDLLLKADGRQIEGGEGLDLYARSRPAGAEVVLELLRENRPVTLRLVVP